MTTTARPASRALVLPDRLTPGETALDARGVGLEIDGRPILADVDLAVAAGEVVALIGPNGAGKSTLLGMLSGDAVGGTARSTGGEIRVAGRPLAAWHVGELARRRAVLSQQNSIAFPFTVLEVVEMGRAPWRRTPLEDEDDDAVRDALAETDTSAFAARVFPSLSGGEAARVSLARVLAQRTGILLLDEPTAALDIRHQEAVLETARRRAAAGDAVVVVLHDLTLAGAYADRVVLLDGGRVHSAGTPAEVLTAAAISEVYQHPVRVIPDPATGDPIVVPERLRTPEGIPL